MTRTRELYKFLRSPVLDAVKAAIDDIFLISDERSLFQDEQRASELANLVEFAYAIEIPENIDKMGAIVLANAFASAVRYSVAGARGNHSPIHIHGSPTKSPLAKVAWNIPPEFDVQHSQIPATEGYTGETFRDFVFDTDRRFCWGPYYAKFYMRYAFVPLSGTKSQNVSRWPAGRSEPGAACLPNDMPPSPPC